VTLVINSIISGVQTGVAEAASLTAERYRHQTALISLTEADQGLAPVAACNEDTHSYNLHSYLLEEIENFLFLPGV